MLGAFYEQNPELMDEGQDVESAVGDFVVSAVLRIRLSWSY